MLIHAFMQKYNNGYLFTIFSSQKGPMANVKGLGGMMLQSQCFLKGH